MQEADEAEIKIPFDFDGFFGGKISDAARVRRPAGRLKTRLIFRSTIVFTGRYLSGKRLSRGNAKEAN
jgi:hypothetical protein